MLSRSTMTTPEIAEHYGRAVTTVQTGWTQHPDWPAPIGKRGRWNEYDQEAVATWVRTHATRTAPTSAGDPAALLTAAEIADEHQLARATVRADISRGRMPDPDEVRDGVRLWRRDTIAAHMARRHSYIKRDNQRDSQS